MAAELKYVLKQQYLETKKCPSVMRPQPKTDTCLAEEGTLTATSDSDFR